MPMYYTVKTNALINSTDVHCVCVCATHWAPLTKTAQQQCCIGGHDAVLHVLSCMLQSYKGKNEFTKMTDEMKKKIQ